MSYNDCVSSASKIARFIHDNLGGGDDFGRRFFIEYLDTRQHNIIEPILILGLNPSGGDEETPNRNNNPNIFWYIDEVWRNERDQQTREEIIRKDLVYPIYFKTYHTFFKELDYHPVWYNESYFNGLLEEFNNEQLISSRMEEYLRYVINSKETQRYFLFADLIQYAKTSSKVMKRFLDAKDKMYRKNTELYVNIMSDLVSYTQTLLTYLKPKLVLVANAAVSDFIIKYFNNEELETSFDYSADDFQTTFVLSSMLTGQRALDRYNRKRLFREIKQYLG